MECPSLSPDGTRIAYKKNTGGTLAAHWRVAFLDLATGKETVLSEPRSVDDQIEWLDDQTLLYGLARDGAAGRQRYLADQRGPGFPFLHLHRARLVAVSVR